MLLSKITINNFRLIVNAELDVHRNITLIVGRNNTAKTSCMSILEKVVKNKVLSYNDYPLQRRKYAFILLAQFMRKKITYEQLCKRLPLTSIEFLIDYSLDDAEDNLGALSPFIIDVDVDTTTALVSFLPNASFKYKNTCSDTNAKEQVFRQFNDFSQTMILQNTLHLGLACLF